MPVHSLLIPSVSHHADAPHSFFSFLSSPERAYVSCRKKNEEENLTKKKKEQCAVSLFSLVFRKDFVGGEQINESDQLFFLTKICKK